MTSFCHRSVASTPSATPVRDPKDVYLLALSDSVKADYLISGDSDLTDMEQHNQTKIVDFTTILSILNKDE